MRIGTREFQTDKHTYIMGILNVTPDSFSDGGKFMQIDRALYHARQMISEGADLLDIGGESSRPGYEMIGAEEEIERVVPVIEAIKKEFETPLSLDTCKSEVAQAGIAAGADMINDIWGLRYDPKMGKVIREGKVACCLMHNRENACYENIWKELKEDLMISVGLAKAAGISEEQIILDPGIGFAKEYEDNLVVLRYLEELRELGFPYLLGASRKSVIGRTLDLPVDQRLEGTLVTSVIAVQAGCSFVRVHDVKENSRAVRMAEAVFR